MYDDFTPFLLVFIVKKIIHNMNYNEQTKDLHYTTTFYRYVPRKTITLCESASMASSRTPTI